MKVNLKAIIIAFVVTLVISIFSGIYLPKNVDLIGPIIGGFIAGYLVGNSYTDGLVNGGIPAGIAGIVTTVTIVLLSSNTINSIAISLGYSGSKETLLLGLIIGSAFAGFALFFVLGILGSIIGVKLKKRNGKQ
jgi:hypothetical protein